MASVSEPRVQQDSELLLRYRKWNIVADAVHLGIPWGSLVLIVVLVAFMVNRLAGKVTMAQIGMSFIGNFRVSEAVAYALGGTCFWYGLNERRLRHKKTKSMASYSAKLEARLDPRRTSSGLTPEGTTSAEDVL